MWLCALFSWSELHTEALRSKRYGDASGAAYSGNSSCGARLVCVRMWIRRRDSGLVFQMKGNRSLLARMRGLRVFAHANPIAILKANPYRHQ